MEQPGRTNKLGEPFTFRGTSGLQGEGCIWEQMRELTPSAMAPLGQSCSHKLMERAWITVATGAVRDCLDSERFLNYHLLNQAHQLSA